MSITEWYFLAIVAATVLGTLAIYYVIAGLGLVGKADAELAEDQRTLVERAAAIRPARTAIGRVDRNFEDTLRGTLFGISSEEGVAAVLIGGGLAALAAFLASDSLLIGLCGLLLGMACVALVFAVFATRRRRAIQDQLPETCFQLSRCLRAGLGLTSAVKETADYTPAPLASVMRAIHERLRMGMHPGEAFTIAAHDVKVTDFDLLAAVIDLHTDVGGNLPLMLDRLAADTRDRNQYRGYFRSVTALGRATTVFVALAAPVAALVYIVVPPEVDLFNYFFKSTLGLILLAVAIVLEVVGIVWAFWLIRSAEEY